MSLSCMNDCKRPLKRPRCSPHQRWRGRSSTMIGKLMPFQWSQVTWSWLKSKPTRGGEKGEGSVGWGTIWSGVPRWCPFLTCEKPVDRMLVSPQPKSTFSHYSDKGDSSLYGCAGQEGQVHHHHPRGTNSEQWDWGSSTKCKLSVTSPVSDRWNSSRMGE